MPNTIDWVPGECVRAIVFGKSKMFKTGGACTFPRPNVMDFDRGIAITRHPKFVKDYGLRSIEYEQFHDVFNSRGVPTSHKAFDSACLYFDKWMSPANVNKFDTWVIDSGTTISRAAMFKAIILLGSAEYKAAKSTTHAAAVLHGLITPKKQDFGAERSMMEQFVAMVMDSGKHFIFICHEKEMYRKVEDDEVLDKIVPLLTGQSVQAIPLMFDEIWHVDRFRVGLEWEYRIRTESDGCRVCGSRYGIPTGIKWDWNTVKKALDEIRAVQTKQAAEAKEKSHAGSTT